MVAGGNRQEEHRRLAQTHIATSKPHTRSRQVEIDEERVIGDPTTQYHIAKCEKARLYPVQWENSHPDDSSVQVCL